MTEQEAIEWQKAFKKTYNGVPEDADIACGIAIKALEEIQQYRAIGTVEEIEQKLAELERWHTTEINPKIRNVFANTSTQICYNCDHKDEYIEELEAEMEEYRAIGTVEECRAAMEKQKAKRADLSVDGHSDGDMVCGTYECPNCGEYYELGYDEYEYCPNCGQHMKVNLEGDGNE